MGWLGDEIGSTDRPDCRTLGAPVKGPAAGTDTVPGWERYCHELGKMGTSLWISLWITTVSH